MAKIRMEMAVYAMNNIAEGLMGCYDPSPLYHGL